MSIKKTHKDLNINSDMMSLFPKTLKTREDPASVWERIRPLTYIDVPVCERIRPLTYIDVPVCERTRPLTYIDVPVCERICCLRCDDFLNPLAQ